MCILMLIDTTIDFNNQIVEVKVSKFSLSLVNKMKLFVLFQIILGFNYLKYVCDVKRFILRAVQMN